MVRFCGRWTAPWSFLQTGGQRVFADCPETEVYDDPQECKSDISDVVHTSSIVHTNNEVDQTSDHLTIQLKTKPLADCIDRDRNQTFTDCRSDFSDAHASSSSDQESSRDTDIDKIDCMECGKKDCDESMLLCDNCNSGCHMWCSRPILVSVPLGPWFCKNCQKPKQIKEFPLIQTKIVDFFKIQHRPANPGPVLDSGKGKALRVKKQRCLKQHTKVSTLLFPHRPSKDPSQRLRQLQSLATALTAVGAKFAPGLVYTSRVHKKANDPKAEVSGSQLLNKRNLEVLDKCEALWRQGEPPPLVVRLDASQGWVVEADGTLPNRSIVTEYGGVVDTFANRCSDASDSMMTLLTTGRDETDLVICPDAHANYARFISGINNDTREGRRKINVRCVRFNIRGEIRALIIAMRDIKKGERLYYDYNGLFQEYPTNHFD